MKLIYTIILASSILLSAFIAAKPQQILEYPATAKSEHIDNYFGTAVPDPYRWLEDSNDPQTKVWIKEQNDLSSQYFSEIPFRGEIRKRLSELMDYPKASVPVEAGEYILIWKNDGLQNQSVLYIQKGLEGTPEILLDPNKLSSDGTISATLTGLSNDNRYAAINLSESGSDWETIRVMDLDAKAFLPDKLDRVKFSTIAWKGNGLYYACHGISGASPDGPEKLYYHRLGTTQEEDKLVYEDPGHPYRLYAPQTTEDERFLILNIFEGSATGNAVFIMDLYVMEASFVKLIETFDKEYAVIDNIGDVLLIKTNEGAPNFRVIQIDSKNPSRQNWTTIIPENPALLESVALGKDKLFLCYLNNVESRLLQFDLSGNFEKDIPVPLMGTADNISYHKREQALLYRYHSFTTPSAIFKYTISIEKHEAWWSPPVKFNPGTYTTKQVWYKSNDGTEIPLYIVHKKGLDISKPRPTLLYGYGGFNICVKPWFDPAKILLLENDGIYAVASLRGGGEFGDAWHEAGKLLNKQNVFDDFIAAAEFLIGEGYASRETLAIHGKSNGGLLVGACMTQRPDLYKVCFPDVGVLDMLRFQNFTVGHFWVSEYGSSDHPEQFLNLYGYSPLHNVRPGIAYPATLVMTGDHDDRVVPAHSYKFAAALQQEGARQYPALIRITEKAGHGAGKPLSKLLDEQTDFWSFMLYHTQDNQ